MFTIMKPFKIAHSKPLFKFRLTNANSSRVIEYGAFRTLAPIATDFVDALSVGAGIEPQILTLVDIFAHIGDHIQLSSSRANALQENNRAWESIREILARGYLLGNFLECYDTGLRRTEGCLRHIRWCPSTFCPCYPPGSQDCKCNGRYRLSFHTRHWCKYSDSERTRWYLSEINRANVKLK